MQSRVLFALFVATIALAPVHAAERLVTVTGEATVAVAPDAAVIRIGVTSQNKTAREASEANAKQMTAVLAAIKDTGIADRDVQTSRLSLQPQYDPNKSGTAHLTGFQATNQVTVRIRDIDKLPVFLDRAATRAHIDNDDFVADSVHLHEGLIGERAHNLLCPGFARFIWRINAD